MQAWKPPFFLFRAGREKAVNKSYRNDPLDDKIRPRRMLIKHTLSGTGTLYVGRKRKLLTPGSILVIERSGPYTYCYESDGQPWCFEYVSIGYESEDFILPQPLRDDPVYQLTPGDELSQLLNELINTRLLPNYEDKLMHSALAYRFFLLYVSIRIRNRAGILPEAVVKLKNMLDNGFDSISSIRDCCQMLGYSTEALTRLFSQSYTISPGRYLRDLRLRHSCDLLSEGDLSVKETAFACGFNSENYFCRLFHQVFGITPGAFSRNPDPLLPEKLSGSKFLTQVKP